MTGLAIAVALVIALAFTGRRWLRRARLRRRLLALPGGRPENAMSVPSFDAIDDEIHRRRCPCGGRYDAYGEGSQVSGGRRLRIVQLECRFCEQQSKLYFDVSQMFH